jgi:cytochrome c peroxidase
VVEVRTSLIAAALALATACLWQSCRAADPFSPAEWSVIRSLSPLPELPVDTTNKFRDSPAAARLGQKLFFDARLSGPIQEGTPAEGQLGAIGEPSRIACRDCHRPESIWLFDTRSNNGGPIPNATALGSKWMTRNASSIVNSVRRARHQRPRYPRADRRDYRKH